MSITRIALAVAGVATTALIASCGTEETQNDSLPAPASSVSAVPGYDIDLVDSWDAGVSASLELQNWAREAGLEVPNPVKPKYKEGGILAVAPFGTNCRTVISQGDPVLGYNVQFSPRYVGEPKIFFDGAYRTNVYRDTDGTLTRAAVAKYGAACGVSGS